MVAIGILTVAEVLQLGLDLLRITFREGVNEATKVKEFRSQYGSSPVVIAMVWSDLITTEIKDAQLDTNDLTDKGFWSFMIANYFCKTYPINASCTGQAFGLSDVYGKGDRVWKWVRKIAALYKTKRFWHESLDDPNGPIIVCTVDGKDQK
jgi:hypothetical protein